MIDSARNSSAELYTLFAALVSVLLAAVLTQIPMLRFGSFFLMAGVLVGADIVLYLLMKLRAFRLRRG